MSSGLPFDASASFAGLSRRNLMQLASLASFGALSGQLGAEEASSQLNRYPRMVHRWFVRRVREAEREKLQRMDRLKTKADAQQYVAAVQKKIQKCFGPRPPRTPLNAQVTGTVERDAYRIENLIFESRPGFPVTANLYLPKGGDRPRPGVVGTCGHSSNGKAAEPYQAFAQGLARLGHVCLIYDPIGQGERLQYVSDDLTSSVGNGVREHLLAGNQQFLVGEFLGMWRAWDGIRALDYLLSRPEVDDNHIGVTGNSGGGTMTTWLCGVEPRWTMAAPSCFVTTFRRNLENELPADTEQCPPRALALGLDHDDFLAAMAPKPIRILAKERDYFDVRGTEEAYERLRRLYRLLGAEENISLFVGPTTHGYSQENREAMYQWFNGVTGLSDADQEPTIELEEDATLQCTPRGQVSEMRGTKTLFDFTTEKAARLAQDRDSLAGEQLREAIRDALKLPSRPQKSPDYRVWRYLRGRDYPAPEAIAYAVDTEPGIQAITYRLTDERWYSRPPQGGPKAFLYISHLSSDRELRDEPLIAEMIEANPETPWFTCDVRGIGESQPGTCQPGSFHDPYGNDYFYAIHSLMLDRPYVGQKTHDVLRVIDWLRSLGHTEVHLVAKGWGALPGTFASVLSPSVRQVTLKNALESYRAVAETEQYSWPLSTLLPDVLAAFDLPQCYRELEKKKQLKQIEPWGPTAGPTT